MPKELIELIRELKELQQEIKLTQETFTIVKQHILKTNQRRKTLTK